MRLAVTLVLLSVSLTACGHGRYDDFVNNRAGDYWGQLGLLGFVVFGVALYAVNRRNDNITKGPRLLLEAGLGGLFLLSMVVGIVYAKDPDGWLRVTTSTIDRMAPR